MRLRTIKERTIVFERNNVELGTVGSPCQGIDSGDNYTIVVHSGTINAGLERLGITRPEDISKIAVTVNI